MPSPPVARLPFERDKIMKEINRYRQKLEKLIDEGQELKILTLISKFHADDIAELLESLDEEDKSKLFRLLDVETASDVIMELNEISRELIIEDMSSREISEIVDDMPSDDAADLIGDLPREQAQEVLKHLDQEKSEDVQMLLEYPEDTAGGIMQTELISIGETSTVTEAIEKIRSYSETVEDFHNVFVTDQNRKLVGVLPLRKLILSKPETRLSSIMNRTPIYVAAEMDQEEVAATVRKYDLVSLPVVDSSMRLLGRIMVDDVIDVIQEEDSEDIFRMAGISEEEDVVYSGATYKVCMKRLPWLVFILFGTLLSGYFLWVYESTLKELLALVTFVPVICAMSGNVGVQSTSIVIRGLATGKIDFMNLKRMVLKEFVVGIVIGLICALIGAGIGLIWHGNMILGVSIFLAMFITITFAAFTGVLIPVFFKKIKIDPAVASGALVTTSNDLIAINIYFLLAALLMKTLN